MQDPTTVPFAPEERAKFRRLNTEQAINLARQSKWEEAVEVNERLIQAFPNDAEALNRLGKALTELGRYPNAVDAYEKALSADPTNTIAQKNVARLRTLKDENQHGQRHRILQQLLHDLKARLVNPVHVLKHDQRRLT